MKNKKVYMALFITMLAILIPLQAALAYEENIPEITEQTDKGANKYMSWDLTVSQIKGLEDLKIQKNINKELLGTVNKIKKQMLRDAKKAYKESKKSEYPFRPFEMIANYDVHYLDSDIMSLTMDIYQYTGGAHGYTLKKAYNYNLKTGKKLSYQDVIKDCPNYKEILIEEITKQIKQNPDIYFENAVDTVKTFTDDQPFYITEKGIVVYYGLYEIAPYSSGIREFLIPFSLFNKCG